MSAAKYFHHVVGYWDQRVGELAKKDTRINIEQFEQSTKEAATTVRVIGDALEVLTPVLGRRGFVKLNEAQVKALQALIMNASADLKWFISEHDKLSDEFKTLETNKEGV